MYKIGDYVVYSTAGVCKITDIKTEKFNNEDKKYYILENVYGNKSYFHIPVNSDSLLKNMRKLHSRNELLEIINQASCSARFWISDFRKRNETNSLIIKSCNLLEIVKLFKNSYENEKRNEKLKKKTSMTDKKFFDTAQKLIFEEYSTVFEKDFEETEKFMAEKLDL